jgi:hypothetical protein
LAYIEARGKSGATDGEFWAQYLAEDEGEPVFGFGEQFGKSLPLKGGEGSGNFDHAGRPGERGGSAPASLHPGRVWAGKQHEGGSELSKLQTGSIGEAATIDVLSQLYGVEFGTVNVNVNNAPFDVAGDSLVVEVKTGLATNDKSAQRWRATIGQPGNAESELLKQMSAEEKRAHNERKLQAILDRKHGLLDKMSKDAGHPIKPMTVCLIMDGEGKQADIFSFDGFHLKINWSQATDEQYLGTYDVTNKIMHWKNPPSGKAIKFSKDLSIYDLVDNSEPKDDEPTDDLNKRALAAALEQIDQDFEQTYQ